jgi:hypothetical protein
MNSLPCQSSIKLIVANPVLQRNSPTLGKLLWGKK